MLALKLIHGALWASLQSNPIRLTGAHRSQCPRKSFPSTYSVLTNLKYYALLCRCNAAPEYPSFFGLTHDNMVHVSDMRVLLTPDINHTDFKTVGFYSPVSQEPFYSGLGLFQLALDEWLPCFQAH